MAKTNGNITVLTGTFLPQSFYDSTALQNALLAQSPSEPIVGSTRVNLTSIEGQTFGLHPSSQTPVGVVPLASEEGGVPGPFWLVPGQVLTLPIRVKGIAWGLPFGWLGGGTAQLLVADGDHLGMTWPQARPEIIFHRQRMKIIADVDVSGLGINPGVQNWPLSFPWFNAARVVFPAATSYAQGGSPVLGIEPTRVLMRLRGVIAAASNPQPMRAIIQQSSAMDLDSTGTPVAGAQYTAVDVTWPVNVGLVSIPYPTIEIIGGPLCAMGGPSALVTLTDVANGGVISGMYVDVARFGRL